LDADVFRAYPCGLLGRLAAWMRGANADVAKQASTMIRSLRVAAVQLRAHDRAVFAQTLPSILDQIADAANGAELVVVPEGTFPAYVLGSEPLDHGAIESAVDALRDLARRTRTVIVAGVASSGGHQPRNAALVIDRDGTVAGRADKLFLWHFDRRWFEAGDRVAPVQTSIGRLGAFVCADGRIPTIARALVDRGAEILVMPTAWVTSGRNADFLENVQADLLARVRARENGVPFVAANKCGTELGMVAYCGKSQVVDAAGDVVAIAPEREAFIVKAVVDVGDPQPFRSPVAQPTPRATVAETPFRVAISFEPLPRDLDTRLEILDDSYAIAPGASERFTTLDRFIPTVDAADDDALDPAGLVGYRRAGYRLVVWTTDGEPAWVERIARARALELRMYVVVLSRAERRAYAVDPDGVVVCGTFGDFTLASFSLDPRKTMETVVAPSTDVHDGLGRIAALIRREEVTPL
jgi:predicted amidohydrolase